jgi:two-component system response regulator DegU
MEKLISIVIASGNRLFREGLHHILNGNKSIKIVGEATDDTQTIDIVDNLKPDVALIDFIIERANDLNIIPTIKEKSPDTKQLMLSDSENEDVILKALKAGARGYLPKKTSISDLIKAIKTVHDGELWVERKLYPSFFEIKNGSENKHKQPPDKAVGQLTPREKEVLYYLTKNYSNKEIAQELSISERTVKSHLTNIFRKLEVTSRLKAILHAINRGLRQHTL